MNHYIAIFDADCRYAKSLEEYINSKVNFPFKAKAFNESKELEENIFDYSPDVILADESMRVTDLKLPIIYLTHSKELQNVDNRKIFKYQRVDILIKKVLDIIANDNVVENVINRKSILKLISFYTPVHKTYSTTTAIALGQELAKKSKVLYINLECFSGFEERFNNSRDKDLTDLLYVLESKKENVSTHILSMSETVNGLDILPVIKNPLDLFSVRYEQWKNMIDSIEQYTDYEYLILDLSDGLDGLFEIKRISDRVVMTVDEDQDEKLRSYLGYLEISKRKDILEKLYELRIPKLDTNKDYRNLLSNGYGMYLRSRLEEILGNGSN